MLKHAVRESALIFPPGVTEREEYLRMRATEIASLKDEIRSCLEKADQAENDGNILYANSENYNATVAMRRLIDMGAL